MEKEDDAKRLAEAAAHMPFPVGILSPRPIDIGIGAPRPLLVEFFECRLGQKHVVTLHTYLHQLTAHEVKYAKKCQGGAADQTDSCSHASCICEIYRPRSFGSNAP